MASTEKNPTELAESGAGNSWQNLQNATGPAGGTDATLLADGAAKLVDITAASLAFAIPAGATIDGIVVSVQTTNAGEGTTFDLAVTARKSGSDTETKTTIGVIDATTTFGSATDKWGSTWTPSDINSNLTVHLQFTLGAGTSGFFTFDAVGVAVYYTVNGVRGRQWRGRDWR